MTYQEETRQLSAKAEAAVLAAYLALKPDEFPEVGAQVVSAFNVAAIALADAALAALLKVLPLGLGPSAGDLERIARGFTTIVNDEPETAQARVVQVARSEPLRAGQRAYQESMVANKDLLHGWTRKTSPGSCEICNALANGSVLSVDDQMVTHPNCSCVSVPVMKERVNA